MVARSLRIVSCLTALAAVAIAAPAAPAAENAEGSFTVAPLKIQVEADPGQTITGTLRVFTSSGGERYAAAVGEARQNDDGSYTYLEPSGRSEDIGSWIEVEPKQFTSGPGATEPINWTIAVPEEADPGDHLGVIYVTQVAEPKAGTVTLQTRIAVRVELLVRGEIVFRPVLRSFSVPKVASGGPIDLTFALANKGNVRLDLREAEKAELAVMDGERTLQRFALVPEDPEVPATIFPGAVRTYEFSWKDPPRGSYDVRLVLDWAKQPALTRSRNLVVVPYRQAGALVATVLGALLIAGFFARRSLQRRREARSGART